MISDFFAHKKVVFSLEVFSPKDENPTRAIRPILSELAQTNPDYISVTYSMGNGSLDNPSFPICEMMQKDFQIPALAHLTCINSSEELVCSQLEKMKKTGLLNILALRGDIREDLPLSESYFHATDLISQISASGGFGISASCYPEPHPQSKDQKQDVKYAKLKEELGATHFITQLFFDNRFYETMMELFGKEGVKSPVDIGVMPVVNKNQAMRIISLCGASLSKELSDMLQKYGDDKAALKEAGIDFAVRQISDLIEKGARGIHLYALNNPEIAQAIYRNIKPILDSVNK